MAVRKRSKEEQYGVIEVVHVPRGLRQTAFGLVPVRSYQYDRNPTLEQQRLREERRNLREDLAILERERVARGELPVRGIGPGPDDEPSSYIRNVLYDARRRERVANGGEPLPAIQRGSGEREPERPYVPAGWTVGDFLRRKNARRRR